MNNTRLSSVKSIKDLGTKISSQPDWNTHINNVVKKCNRKLGLIKRTVCFQVHLQMSPKLCILPWSGVILSLVDAFEVVPPDTMCLVGVQRRATKLCTFLIWTIRNACANWICSPWHYAGNSLTFRCFLSVLLVRMTWKLIDMLNFELSVWARASHYKIVYWSSSSQGSFL